MPLVSSSAGSASLDVDDLKLGLYITIYYEPEDLEAPSLGDVTHTWVSRRLTEEHSAGPDHILFPDREGVEAVTADSQGSEDLYRDLRAADK